MLIKPAGGFPDLAVARPTHPAAQRAPVEPVDRFLPGGSFSALPRPTIAHAAAAVGGAVGAGLTLAERLEALGTPLSVKRWVPIPSAYRQLTPQDAAERLEQGKPLLLGDEDARLPLRGEPDLAVLEAIRRRDCPDELSQNGWAVARLHQAGCTFEQGGHQVDPYRAYLGPGKGEANLRVLYHNLDLGVVGGQFSARRVADAIATLEDLTCPTPQRLHALTELIGYKELDDYLGLVEKTDPQEQEAFQDAWKLCGSSYRSRMKSLVEPLGETTFTDRVRVHLHLKSLGGDHARWEAAGALYQRALQVSPTPQEARRVVERLTAGDVGNSAQGLQVAAKMAGKPDTEKLFLAFRGHGFDVARAASFTELLEQPAGGLTQDERLEAFRQVGLGSTREPLNFYSVKQHFYDALKKGLAAGREPAWAVERLARLGETLVERKRDEAEAGQAAQGLAELWSDPAAVDAMLDYVSAGYAASEAVKFTRMLQGPALSQRMEACRKAQLLNPKKPLNQYSVLELSTRLVVELLNRGQTPEAAGSAVASLNEALLGRECKAEEAATLLKLALEHPGELEFFQGMLRGSFHFERMAEFSKLVLDEGPRSPRERARAFEQLGLFGKADDRKLYALKEAMYRHWVKEGSVKRTVSLFEVVGKDGFTDLPPLKNDRRLPAFAQLVKAGHPPAAASLAVTRLGDDADRLAPALASLSPPGDLKRVPVFADAVKKLVDLGVSPEQLAGTDSALLSAYLTGLENGVDWETAGAVLQAGGSAVLPRGVPAATAFLEARKLVTSVPLADAVSGAGPGPSERLAALSATPGWAEQTQQGQVQLARALGGYLQEQALSDFPAALEQLGTTGFVSRWTPPPPEPAQPGPTPSAGLPEVDLKPAGLDDPRWNEQVRRAGAEALRATGSPERVRRLFDQAASKEHQKAQLLDAVNFFKELAGRDEAVLDFYLDCLKAGYHVPRAAEAVTSLNLLEHLSDSERVQCYRKLGLFEGRSPLNAYDFKQQAMKSLAAELSAGRPVDEAVHRMARVCGRLADRQVAPEEAVKLIDAPPQGVENLKAFLDEGHSTALTRVAAALPDNPAARELARAIKGTEEKLKDREDLVRWALGRSWSDPEALKFTVALIEAGFHVDRVQEFSGWGRDAERREAFAKLGLLKPSEPINNYAVMRAVVASYEAERSAGRPPTEAVEAVTLVCGGLKEVQPALDLLDVHRRHLAGRPGAVPRFLALREEGLPAPLVAEWAAAGERLPVDALKELGIHQGRSPFDDPGARQAVYHAFDLLTNRGETVERVTALVRSAAELRPQAQAFARSLRETVPLALAALSDSKATIEYQEEAIVIGDVSVGVNGAG